MSNFYKCWVPGKEQDVEEVLATSPDQAAKFFLIDRLLLADFGHVTGDRLDKTSSTVLRAVCVEEDDLVHTIALSASMIIRTDLVTWFRKRKNGETPGA